MIFKGDISSIAFMISACLCDLSMAAGPDGVRGSSALNLSIPERNSDFADQNGAVAPGWFDRRDVTCSNIAIGRSVGLAAGDLPDRANLINRLTEVSRLTSILEITFAASLYPEGVGHDFSRDCSRPSADSIASSPTAQCPHTSCANYRTPLC